MSEISIVNKCPITNDTDRFTYIDLGSMPLVNNLTETREDSLNAPKYKLLVQHFKKSKLSCLTENVDPNLLFSQYMYKSGVSKAFAEHCKEMFWFMDTYLNLKEGDKVLDIGGNDGTLLETFLGTKSYLDVLNVDASTNICEISKQKGVPTYCGYWGVETSKKLNTKFKLITSTNVFQHTPPLVDFAEAVSLSLEDRGIWCLEFPYWKSNMETKQYDQIYHEHVYYYFVEPLKTLFERFGLEIIKAVKYPIHGGSLRLLIAKKDAWSVCEGVQKVIDEEQAITEEYYKQWGSVVEKHIQDCREFLLNLKAEGNTLAGFGAAAKGCIFLNSARIDHTTLDVVIDDTNLKQDKFIPGTGIQIRSRDYLKSHKIDYILILAHNFKDAIMDSLKHEYTGKYIVLFPEIKVL
jgi:2-polyprenyl-3-methyl-5-hydroxy-6-metoxy-1,4-benzoquinol methylase